MAESNASGTMRTAAGIVGSGGLGALILDHGIGGTFYAIFEVFIGMIYSLGDSILGPFLALYGGITTFVDRTIMSGLDIIDAGGSTSAGAVTEWGLFGYVVGIAIVLVGLALVVLFMRQSEWRPWDILRG